MEHQPLYSCHDCYKNQPKEQFNLRKMDSPYGQKGEPTSRCTECTTRNQQNHRNSKRKRVNEDPDPPTEAPVLSFEQFTTTLTKHAQRGDLRFRVCVSTQEPTGDNDEVTKAAVGRIWEATGFRFTFVHFHLRIQVFLLTYGY